YEGQPGFQECFMPQGQAPAPGEHFSNPQLADSMRLIADSKGDAFYHGELADTILRHSTQYDGLMTKDDLASYQPQWCGTLQQHFAGADVHEIPPNAQGLATL